MVPAVRCFDRPLVAGSKAAQQRRGRETDAIRGGGAAVVHSGSTSAGPRCGKGLCRPFPRPVRRRCCSHPLSANTLICPCQHCPDPPYSSLLLSSALLSATPPSFFPHYAVAFSHLETWKGKASVMAGVWVIQDWDYSELPGSRLFTTSFPPIAPLPLP